jgi:hypothetical protein
VAGGLFGGSLDASNAAADAQTQAQNAYAAQHPVKSFIGQTIGGLAATPAGTARALPTYAGDSPLITRLAQGKVMGPLPANPATIPAAPSISDLKTAAKAAYDNVDNAGLVIGSPSYDRMVADLQAKLANEGIDKTLHPNAMAAFNRLTQEQGNNITMKGMDTLRRVSSDAVGASLANPSDKRLGYLIQNHIDDFVGGLTPTDIIATNGVTDPAQAVANLGKARDLWSRASQVQLIQSQIDKAGIKASANYSQSGMENALRQQFKSLALNDRAMARLSPTVQQAVKDVASGSPVGNVLRSVGKYAPHGPVATAAGMGVGAMMGGIHGAAGGGLASIALPVAGETARLGATRLTMSAAERARDLAALGRTAALPSVAPALQLPQLTARSAIPYGLFGSGMLQPAQ